MGSTEYCKRRRSSRSKFTSMGDHNKFISRIRKSLYYGQLPSTERLSLPVTELATELFSASHRKHSLQRLDLQEASKVSRSACVSPCSLVLALLYVERLQSSQPTYLRNTPPSELYLVSLMVATKFLQDEGEDDGVINEEWATSAGISTTSLNQLEREFLDAIDWEVYVNEEMFWTRLRGLERDVALNQGAQRGWFSYADLDCLLEKVDLASLAHSILMVSAVCITSYTASVLTLVASTMLVSHIQPLIGSLSCISQSSLNSTSVPMISVDKANPEPFIDSSSVHDYKSPLDVLTTSFILASISSCHERLGNNSDRCSDETESLLDNSISNNILEMMDITPSTVDTLESGRYDVIRWSNFRLFAWLDQFPTVYTWLRGPVLSVLESPPDWATTLSYCIDRDASQSRLIPLQVY